MFPQIRRVKSLGSDKNINGISLEKLKKKMEETEKKYFKQRIKSEPVLILDSKLPKKLSINKPQIMNIHQKSLEKPNRLSPKRNKKSISSKIIQVQKLRTQLKMDDPQKKLKIGSKNHLQKIELQKNQYRHLEFENQEIQRFYGKLNPILQNNKIILQSEHPQIISIPKFETMIKISNRLSEIIFFKYFLHNKIFTLWASKIRKKKHHKAKKQSVEIYNKKFYSSLTQIKIISFRQLNSSQALFNNLSVSNQNFETTILNSNYQTIEKKCKEFFQNVFENVFEQLYRDIDLNRRISRKQKKFLLLQTIHPSMSKFTGKFSHLKQIWTDYKFDQIIDKFRIHLKLVIYQLGDCFLYYYQQILGQIRFYLQDELDFSDKIPIKQYLLELLQDKQIKHNHFLKVCQRCLQGISLTPTIQLNNNQLKLNFDKTIFQGKFMNFIHKITNLKKISINFLTDSQEQKLFFKEILKSNDTYKLQKLIKGNSQCNQLHKDIKRLLKMNAQKLLQRYQLISQSFQQILNDIKVRSVYFQQCQLLIQNFTFDKQQIDNADKEQEERKSRQIQKSKNIVMQSYLFYCKKIKIIQKLPQRIKAGIFSIIFEKSKQIFLRFGQKMRNKSLQILMNLFIKIIKQLEQQIKNCSDNISLYYCQMNQFIISTKTQIHFQKMYCVYLGYLDNMISILNFINSKYPDTNITHYEANFKAIKMKIEELKYKINLFDQKKVNRLKQFLKEKSKKVEQIQTKITAFQNEVYELFNSKNKSVENKFAYFPQYQQILSQMRSNINNLLYVQNMQIDYCIVDKLSQFPTFYKLQSSLKLLKSFISKFIQIGKKVKKTQNQDFYKCQTSIISNLAQQAISEIKSGQLTLLPFTYLMKVIKDQYTQIIKFYKIVHQLQMFTQAQLTQIYKGELFDFRNKQYYSIKQIRSFHIEHYSYQTKEISIKKFYGLKADQIEDDFYNFVKDEKIFKENFQYFSTQNMPIINLYQPNSRKKSMLDTQATRFRKKNYIKQFLDQKKLQIVQIYQIIHNFEKQKEDPKKRPNQALAKLINVQTSIQNILEVLSIFQKKREQLDNISVYYQIIKQNKSLQSTDLTKQIEKLKNMWSQQILECIAHQGFLIIIKEKQRILNKIESLSLVIQKIKFQMDNKVETALKQTPIMYLFPKRNILQYLSNPIQFFLQNYEFIQSAQVEKNTKILRIETFYQETLEIKLYHKNIYSINEINNKMAQIIQKSIKNAIKGNNKSAKFDESARADLLQIQFIKEMIKLQKQLKKLNKSGQIQYLTKRVENITKKGIITENKMLKFQIIISACIQMRQKLSLSQQQGSLSCFYYSYQQISTNNDGSKSTIKINQLSKSFISYEQQKLNQKQDGQKFGNIEKSSFQTKFRPRSRTINQSACMSLKKKKRESIQKSVMSQEKSLPQKKQIVMSLPKIKKGLKLSIKHNNSKKRLEKPVERFQIFYNNFFKQLQLSSNLIDFRSLAFYPGSQRMLLSYFNAFYDPSEINIINNSQNIKEFSARLFKKSYVVNKNSLSQQEFSFAIKNILSIKDISIVITSFQGFFQKFSKVLSQISNKLSLENNYLDSIFRQEAIQMNLKNILDHNSVKPSNIFILSKNEHINTDSMNTKYKHTFRTIHHEIPPVQLKLEVYRYTLQQRFQAQIIDILICYMKTYCIFLTSSVHNQIKSNQLQDIFIWLLQGVSKYYSHRKYETYRYNLKDILSIPYRFLNLTQFQQKFIVQKYFQKIQSIFQLRKQNQLKDDQIFQPTIETRIQQSLQLNKIVVLVGCQCTGKTYLIKNFIKQSRLKSITINVKVQNLFKGVLNSELSLQNYLRSYLKARSQNFRNQKDYFIILEGFLTDQNQLLYEYLIDLENMSEDQKLFKGFIIQKQDLSKITPKLLPLISILNIDQSTQILSASISQVAQNYQNLFQKAVTDQISIQIKNNFDTVGELVNKIMDQIQQKYFNFKINTTVIIRNIIKMITSFINLIEEQESSQKIDNVIEFQNFIIGYSIFWIIFYCLSKQGQHILIKVKESIPQISSLGRLQNPIQCQDMLKQYSIKFNFMSNCNQYDQNIYHSHLYFSTLQNQQIVRNCLWYLSNNNQIIVYGPSGSGKSKIIERIVSKICSQKRICFFTGNYSSTKQKIARLQQQLVADNKLQTTKVSQKLISLSKIQTEVYIEKYRIIIIEDNALQMQNQRQQSDIIFNYLKFISENNYIYYKNKFPLIQTPCMVIERRDNYNKNNINWDALPIFFSPNQECSQRIFSTIVKRLQTIYQNTSSFTIKNQQVRKNNRLKLNINRDNEITLNFKNYLRKSQMGVPKWLDTTNHKLIDRSLLMFIRILQDKKIKENQQLIINTNNSLIQQNKKRRPSITSNLQNPQNFILGNKIMDQFMLILQFSLINMNHDITQTDKDAKQIEYRVYNYLKYKYGQLQRCIIPSNCHSNQEIMNDKMWKNLYKISLSVQFSQIIFVNQLQRVNGRDIFASLFQNLGYKLVKIDGLNEAIDQIKRYQQIQSKTYFYISLQTLEANPDLLAYIEVRVRQNFYKFNPSNNNNKLKQSLKILSSGVLKTQKCLDINTNQAILNKLLDEVFIIEYPNNNQLVMKFLQCKFLTENATILRLFQNQPDQMQIQLKSKQNMSKEPTTFVSSNSSLYNQMRLKYCQVHEQVLNRRYKTIQNIYNNLKQISFQKIPQELWNSLFISQNFNSLIKMCFKLYKQSEEKICSYMKTTKTANQALQSVFEQFQKLNRELRHQKTKYSNIKHMIIDLQKNIDRLSKRIIDLQNLGVVEEQQNLKTQLQKNKKAQEQYLNRMNKYRTTANKAQENLTRQQIAELKYFYNTNFTSYKNLFESIYHCLTQQYELPDNQSLRKYIMDMNLVLTLKQQNLLQICNIKLIETIKSKLQDFEPDSNSKNIYNWIQYSLKYCTHNLQIQQFLKALESDNDKKNERISYIHNNMNINAQKQKVVQLQITKNEHMKQLNNTGQIIDDLNNKIIKLEPIIQQFHKYKKCCPQQISCLQKYQQQLESSITMLALQFIFGVSVPQLYRWQFRKIVRKQITKVYKFQISTLQNCLNFYINLIMDNQRHKTYYENQMMLTSAKKSALLGLSYLIEKETVIIYDPFNSFTEDLSPEFIQVQLQDLLNPEIMTTLMQKSLIIINLPQNQWNIEYIRSQPKQNTIYYANYGHLEGFDYVKINKIEIKLLSNQRCIFMKSKINKLPQIANRFKIICYDFASLSQDIQLSEKVLNYKLCAFQQDNRSSKQSSQIYESIQKYQKNLNQLFYTINQEICLKMVSFTIGHLEYLQKIYLNIKQYLNWKNKIDKTRHMFELKEQIANKMKQQKLSLRTGTAFNVFKNIVQKQKHNTESTFQQSNGIQKHIPHKILLSGIQFACQYSVEDPYNFVQNYLKHFMSFLLIGVNDVQSYFIELKILYDEIQKGHTNIKSLKIEKVEYLKNIINQINGTNHTNNYQRIKDKFKTTIIGNNLNSEKILSKIIKKLQKQNITSKEVLQMIESNCEISEVDKICLKQLFNCHRQLEISQNAFLIQVSKDMFNKYYYSNKLDSYKLLVNSLFSIKKHKSPKLTYICETASNYWMNVIYRNLKKSQNILNIQNTSSMKYLTIKLSTLTDWKNIFIDVGKRQMQNQQQKIKRILQQQYFIIVIQDCHSPENLKNLKDLIHNTNTIILTQNKINLNQKKSQVCQIALSQFLGIFMKAQDSLRNNSIFMSNSNVIKFWEQQVKEQTLKWGNITASLYIYKYYQIVGELINILEQSNYQIEEKITLFEKNIKQILNNLLLPQFFTNTAQMNNYMAKTVYMIKQQNNIQKSVVKLWQIIHTKNELYTPQKQIIFESEIQNLIGIQLKQNLIKLRAFSNKIQNLEKKIKNQEELQSTQQIKIYLRNHSKFSILKHIHKLILQFIKIGSVIKYNKIITRQDYCYYLNKYRTLNIEKIRKLLDMIKFLKDQQHYTHFIFLNYLDQAFCVYLIKLISSQPLNLLELKVNKNEQKQKIVYLTINGQYFEMSQSCSQQILQKLQTNKNQTFQYKLTQHNHYFKVYKTNQSFMKLLN